MASRTLIIRNRTIRYIYEDLENFEFSCEPEKQHLPRFKKHTFNRLQQIIDIDRTSSPRQKSNHAGFAKQTIKKYLQEYFGLMKRCLKKFHTLSNPHNKLNTVDGARLLLQRLRVHELLKFNNLITGDETWVSCRFPDNFLWQPPNEPAVPRLRLNIVIYLRQQTPDMQRSVFKKFTE
ncbi:hypothetical protein BLNAU_11307 [Blattamonas nauphoetae]|uniref:Transposase n=1 Tax=Blattamonas nauphoetae TaxID=2049346 RepID=A0ABQ9XQI5_9EUKA|nr:hypothetical protein BLNAU_11307 [Blattamonas nauphoetae]